MVFLARSEKLEKYFKKSDKKIFNFKQDMFCAAEMYILKV